MNISDLLKMFYIQPESGQIFSKLLSCLYKNSLIFGKTLEYLAPLFMNL